MTEFPTDKIQVKGPLADYGYKVTFDLPEEARDAASELMKNKRDEILYVIVMNEEEYKVVKEKK